MKFIKKYRGYILSFLLPLIIYLLFFFWKGVFTDKTILNSDMAVQYQPLFQYLKDVLHGNATFPYSFSKGLGGGMYGSLFYYFANPLNLLVYFFENIPLFLTLLVILKLSLSGLTMYTFLKYKFKDEKYLLVFSLAYAFMGYNINYYVSIMWLDGVVLAPIILLGIDCLLENKKDWLYIITLFAAIFLNYYIGYMLVVFSIIYFMYVFLLKYGKNWKKEKKQIFHFLLLTALVGLTTSFILIPSGLELLNVSRVTLNGGNRWINLNFLDFIASTYIGFGNLVNPLNYYGFLIFSGTIIIPLVICYFFNKKISRREKLLTAVVYSFFLLPIIFPIFNRLWHMFTLPIAFNYRYSFLTTLFTILIVIRSLKLLEIPKKPLIIYFTLYIVLSISLGFTSTKVSDYYIYITIPKIVVTVLLLGIYILLLLKNKIKLILILLVLELLANITWIGLESKMPSQGEYMEIKGTVESFSKQCEKNKRCEIKFGYSFNESFLGNYNGISSFISTMNGNVTQFLSKIGNTDEDRNYYIYHPDIVLDMLLGIKVLELQEKILDYELLEEYSVNSKTLYLYNNPYALELGYLVSSNLKDFTMEEEGFFYLQDILNVMVGEKTEYFYKLPLEKLNDREYKLVKDKKYSYLYLYGDEVININGKPLEKLLLSADTYGMIYDEYGDTFIFTFEEPVEKFEVYVLDMERIKEFKENRTELVIDQNTGNKIEGHIAAKENSTLFTSIPYEKGWRVLVDGEEVKPYEVLDTFLALDLEEGYHTITFEYHVYGLKLGFAVSIISFLFLLGYKYKYNKKIKYRF